jgi:DNA polymerase II small subunit
LNLPEEKKKRVENLKIKLGLSISISKEISEDVSMKQGTLNDFSDVKILSSDIVFNKKIEVSDFVKHLRNRFIEMRKILQEHSELNNLVSINKISDSPNRAISLIGFVSDKRTTKNKNILLELEDLTGKIVALVNCNKPDLYKKADDLTLDSIIGIKCSGSREIVFVNDIIFPEASLFERKKSPIEEYSLFTGDLHIGSKNFMEENFLRFVNYLNRADPETNKIKYLFLIGDLISGVGIYPEQEKVLAIPDIEEQFQKAAELLGKIRKDIKIILTPGNHDGLRIMEPQPILDEKYAWPLYDLKNVTLTTNPCFVNFGAKKGFSGFNILLYHGFSFPYYANNINYLMKDRAINVPEKIMAYLLKNRHLAPTHTSTLHFPSEEDHLMIKQVPDIFFAGHLHKSAVAYYNNILNISSSSWETMTSNQEKMGNQPDFCKVPMLNMKTREIKILDFE